MADIQTNTKGQNKALLKAIAEIKMQFGIDQGEIANRLGKNETYFSGVLNGYKPLSGKLIDKIYEVFQIRVEDDYEGQMLKKVKYGTTESFLHYIRLLPISAIGGNLNEFVTAVKDFDCERIISPIKDCDFAITITGNSMYPEYPAGSQILIKKIDERQFIEWGRTYVLDTANGTVVKKLIKGDPEYFHCVSANPDQERYAPFDIPLTAVYGIYRVLMIMSMK